MVGLSFAARLPTVLDAAGRYLMLTLWPAKLSLDYSFPVLPVVHTLTPYGLLGLLTGLGLVAVAWIYRARPVGWGAAFALLSFLPVSNLFIVIGTNLAERLFYMPSAGLLLVLAEGGKFLLHKMARSRRAAMIVPPAVVAALALACSLRTWTRNADYRNEESMYRAGVADSPRSAKMHGNYALVLNRAGRFEEALAEAKQAYGLDSTLVELRQTLAAALEGLKRNEDAIRFLRAEVVRDPQDGDARRRLLRLLQEAGRTAEIRGVLQEAVTTRPGEVEWTIRLAQLEQGEGNYSVAARIWREVTRRMPDTADAPLYLAFCLLSSGAPEQAVEVYRAYLQRFPQSPEAANGLAWSLLEAGRPAEEAVRWSEQAVALQPIAPYYDTLARAYLAAGRCSAARKAAESALKLDPESSSTEALRQEIERRCPE